MVFLEEKVELRHHANLALKDVFRILCKYCVPECVQMRQEKTAVNLRPQYGHTNQLLIYISMTMEEKDYPHTKLLTKFLQSRILVPRNNSLRSHFQLEHPFVSIYITRELPNT
jgi:hypothetical protein